LNKEYITPAEAVKLYEEKGYGWVGKFTIVDWCKRYDIGLKIGGRWKVDKQKFEQMLIGGTYAGNS